MEEDEDLIITELTELDELDSEYSSYLEASYDNYTQHYNDNGVEIYNGGDSWHIKTSLYDVVWRKFINIANNNKSYITEIALKFDMSLFAIVKSVNAHFWQIKIIWSSEEVVNSQIEKLLIYKTIKRIPQLKSFI